MQGIGSGAALHHLDEPTRLFLGVVALPTEFASVWPGKIILASIVSMGVNFGTRCHPLVINTYFAGRTFEGMELFVDIYSKR